MKNVLSKMVFWKTKSQKEVVVNDKSGGAKKFFSKISGAFMLPISVMAIAGLFLGIGATIASNTDSDGVKKLGLFIQNLGDPIFGAMPALFAAAIVVAFTDEAGVGVFASIVGMLIFAGIQMVFIDPVKNATGDLIGYNVLFEGGGRDPESMKNLVGTTFGITSLNSSVFGGIVVGGTVAYLYNRFHTIQLPQVISFFGGKRFVSLVTIVAAVPLALLFLLLWPWIGRGLSEFGKATGKVPGGVESFIFGFVERALIPFGLHHVFYAPLWWTNAGGDAHQAIDDFIKAGNTFTGASLDAFVTHADVTFKDASKWVGDTYIWQSVNGLSFNDATWIPSGGGAAQSKPLFEFFSDQLEIKLGRYMQGKYSFMMFGLPLAGLAMVLAAPKENRKMALGTVFPAALTSFMTGVTEPIEFTFLFLAPWLYWGFHCLIAALSFLLMNVAGAHVGMTFSGGVLDMIIYGAIPFNKGTNFYWMFVIGAGCAPIYFFVFYWWIKRFNLATPGRGGNVKLFTKADYKSKKSGATERGAITEQSKKIVIALGGWDNITKYTNCATRLRYDIKDKSKVDKDALKSAGAVGVMDVGENHVQVIMGPVAEQINTNIKGNIGKPLS